MTELTSWTDILRYLSVSRCRYQVIPGVAVVDYDHAGRRSLVSLRPVRSSPAPDASMWLVLSIDLGPGTALVLRAALVANLLLPIGAICLLGDKAVLQLTLPLGGLLVQQLDEAMASLVKVAHEVYQPARAQDGAFAWVYR